MKFKDLFEATDYNSIDILTGTELEMSQAKKEVLKYNSKNNTDINVWVSTFDNGKTYTLETYKSDLKKHTNEIKKILKSFWKNNKAK